MRHTDLIREAERSAREDEVGLWGTPPESTATPTRSTNTRTASACHGSYDPCLPITDDLDCADVRELGIAPVRVVGPDAYRLDGDHDGEGCE